MVAYRSADGRDVFALPEIPEFESGDWKVVNTRLRADERVAAGRELHRLRPLPLPEEADRCRGYCLIGRNYDFDDPDSTLLEFERVIFGQYQRIVESQRPEQVPFDLADELHLMFDAVAVAYRRAARAEGLGVLGGARAKAAGDR